MGCRDRIVCPRNRKRRSCSRAKLVYERTCSQSCRDAVTVRCWNRYAQYALHCHGVAAISPILEEAAGAIPLTIIKVCCMYIILAPECGLEASKLDALRLFCITLGFCDLVDDA